MATPTHDATLHVGVGKQLGPLTWFPVWSDSDPYTGHCTHVQAAGALQVAECQQPQVPRLTVTNTSHHPVLLLEGQTLTGGMQDRITTASQLLAPDTTIDIPVACVERGRWARNSAGLRPGGHATPTLRAGNSRALALTSSPRLGR